MHESRWRKLLSCKRKAATTRRGKRKKIEEEARVLREKQTAHEMAEKFALEQQNPNKFEKKMTELEERDAQRRKHVQDEILKYREQSRIKLKRKRIF